MSLPTRSSTRTRVERTGPKRQYLDVQIRSEIARVLEDHRNAAGCYSPATQKLWSRIGDALEGGKLTRPRLAVLGYEAFAEKNLDPGSNIDTSRAITMGCAFELLHVSLLMHDDVIDRDFTRRGRPTLSARYRDDALAKGQSAANAEHAGHAAAIIAGDLLLATSIKLAMRAAHSLPHAAAIEESFHQGIHHAGAGELEDMLFSLEQAPAKVQEVLRMEELKTAAYSFRVPLHTGALLAGADPERASALADIGSQLGVAYQLIDDVLGTFGNPELTGKSNESDLREGKSTILTAVAAATPGFAEDLRRSRGHTGDLASIRATLKSTGAETFARQLANELCAAATTASNSLALPTRVSAEIEDLAGLILNRGA